MLVATCPEKIRIVQLVSTSEEDHLAVAERVAEEVGKLDVVIANAGWRSSPFSCVFPFYN
jgi:NAD(P)-dependent dehydrogenase (short-subunit alcohol dehydrogenase family)